ncbi:hypothetical protein fugu_012159 [Takifugu bimaculatus]|uniref:Uncharacterized protein n=1 Tax=Takifugu bimaculatus TaxID=433685 RepID=A0A4Z2C9M4_9TELE|nr:hypothetical protein fugu_012159 [Takifugu bimaculatus]
MAQGCLRQAHRTMTKVNTTPHEQQELMFASVTTYKCTLEMLQTAKVPADPKAVVRTPAQKVQSYTESCGDVGPGTRGGTDPAEQKWRQNQTVFNYSTQSK